MAGTIAFLRYQQIDHWRRAFSVRSSYDKLSFFLGLLILLGAYRFITLLVAVARESANGNSRPAGNIVLAAALIWFIPAFEGRRLSADAEKFVFLPIGRLNLALASLFNPFLVPSATFAVAVSAAAAVPFLYGRNSAATVLGSILYFLAAAFSAISIVRLLRYFVVRIMLLASASFVFVLLRDSISWPDYALSIPLVRMAEGEGVVLNLMLLSASVFIAVTAAFTVSRFAAGQSETSTRRLSPRLLSRISLPLKLGELIKKDFSAAWKLLDCWIAADFACFYTVILVPAEFSFSSFSVALSITAMLNASIAFNFFGLETSGGFERLRLSPVKPLDLLAAKCRVFWLVLFIQVFFLFPIILVHFGIFCAVAAVAKTIAIGLLYSAWGMRLSLAFPFRMNGFEMSFGGSIPATFAGVAAATVPIVVPDLLTNSEGPGIAAVNLLLVPLAYFFYRLMLKKAVSEMPRAWDRIATSLE